MNSYHNHSVPAPEPSVSFRWILDNVMDVTSLIITFGESEAQAACFGLNQGHLELHLLTTQMSLS